MREEIPDMPITENTMQAATEQPKQSEDSFPVILVVLIGSIVLVAIIAAVAAIVRKRKISKEETNAAPVSPTMPSEQLPPIDYEPTEPLYANQQTDEAEPVASMEHQAPDVKLWLVAVGGQMNGRMYPIDQNGITIGRDISNIVRYSKNTPGVSRKHAELSWEDGRLMLTDCNSTSGTFIKGVGKLQPMHSFELNSGDIFYIGEKSNSFEIRSN